MRLIVQFQSTPVIANGRILFGFTSSCTAHLFQSTPVIANGRILIEPEEAPGMPGFNPRPLLLTGESFTSGLNAGRALVSIHARYC